MTTTTKIPIQATTYVLHKDASNENQKALFFEGKTYTIPIYQRPYSWKETHIKKFISDILISFHGYSGEAAQETLFIGTIQLSKKEAKNTFEVIDGQQRISTLLILIKELSRLCTSKTNLQTLHKKWIETHVNEGTQEELLNEYWDLEDIQEVSEVVTAKNRYIANAVFIHKLLIETFGNPKDPEIQEKIQDFADHICSYIYFVVIITEVNLTKTLQIFDTINTTGLDLNGSDVFKIKMYEYLTTKKKKGSHVFSEINALYGKIDTFNKEAKFPIHFLEILTIYKMILISKNKLPKTLHDLGTSNFFERLFDVIFDVQPWKNFQDAATVELSIADIDSIIDARIAWFAVKFPTIESECAIHFIWWSRYNRFWTLAIVFMRQYKGYETKNYQELVEFIRALSKLYFLQSIFFSKIINHIKTFSYNILDDIILHNKTPELIIEKIKTKMADRVWQKENRTASEVLKGILQGNIVYRPRQKNLICRLSAMLDEAYTTDENKFEVIQQLFHYDTHPKDIEHIEPFKNKDKSTRNEIYETWKDDLHSIGNVILLERSINQKIKNDYYAKKVENYQKSELKTIHKLIETYTEWTLEKAQERKAQETIKIMKYFFGEQIQNT